MATSKDLRSQDVRNMTFTSDYSKEVTETKMLSGEAQDSLTGKNTTKPDQRAGQDGGKKGGLPMH